MPARKGGRAATETMPVEVFLDGFPPPMRVIAQQLRAVMRRASPEASERVRLGWRLIAYDLRMGRRQAFFAWVGLEERHVHLGFPRGSQMERDDLLKGAGITKYARWLTFVPGDPIDEDLIVELVREAARIAWLPRSLPWSVRAPIVRDRRG